MFDYILLLAITGSSMGVVLVGGPVHSVLFLVLTFFFSSVLLRSVGVEFLGLLLMVVYMGAIAVLFRFVVMMLDLKSSEAQVADDSYVLPAAISMVACLLMLDGFSSGLSGEVGLLGGLHPVSAIESLGLVLYTHYYPLYLVAGYVLLVALIGAVVMAVPRSGEHLGKQDLATQLARDPADAIFRVQA